MSESQQMAPTRSKADEEEFVEFFRAGERGVGSFECVACSYGAVVRGELPSCPMCRAALWERAAWTPFGRTRSALGERLQ